MPGPWTRYQQPAVAARLPWEVYGGKADSYESQLAQQGMTQEEADAIDSEAAALSASHAQDFKTARELPAAFRRSDALQAVTGVAEGQVSQMADPLKTTERLIETAAISTGLAAPGSQLIIRPSEYINRSPLQFVPDIPGGSTAGGKLTAGAVNALKRVAEFFTSPAGVGLLLSGGSTALPNATKKALSASFAADMLAHAPAQFKAADEALQQEDYNKAGEAATSFVLSTGLSALAARHAMYKDGIRATKRPVDDTPSGPGAPEPVHGPWEAYQGGEMPRYTEPGERFYPQATPVDIPPVEAQPVEAAPGTITGSNAGKAAEMPAERGAIPRRGVAQVAHPPDLIDELFNNVGHIDPGLIRESDPNWKPVGAARKLFKTGGIAADSALNAITYEGPKHGVGSDTPMQEFGEAVNAAARGRIQTRLQRRGENRLIDEEERQHVTFNREASRSGPDKEPLVPDDLQPGDEFTVQGAKVKVREFDFDDNGEVVSVTLDDGNKFGTQKVEPGKVIHADKDSLVSQPVPEFAPPERAESLTLAPPENVAEQQARLDSEAAQRERTMTANAAAERDATAKRRMLERPTTPLGGDLGSAGQGGLFAEPGQQEIFQPKAPGGTSGEPLRALGELGMGGATPSELSRGPSAPTSIKNAQVDIERAQRGLPPAVAPARRAFAEVWDAAMAKIDADPAAQDKFMDEVRERPRALTDMEDAMLLHRQIDLQNEYGRLTRDLANAYEDAKTFPERAEAYDRLRLEVARVSDALLDLYEINKKVGTETGRGLAARRMLAFEDYTLAAMELGKRAANDGSPLTEAQSAEVGRLQSIIETNEKAYQERLAARDEELAGQRAEAAVREMELTARAQPLYDSRIIKIAEEIVSKLEKAAAKSDVVIREMLSRTGAGVDPTLLYHLGVKGAAIIARGGLDLAKFTDVMVKEYGEKLRAGMAAIWQRANFHLENEGAKYGDKAEPVKRLLRHQDESGRRENIVAGLKKASAEGQPLDMLGDYVRKLAESFVRAGIKTRDALVDAVHGELRRELMPDITRREAMDAISGYGKFKPLNPDAIKAELRALKGQMQQVAKLEDITARVPLQKTGLERRVVGDEERRLIQQVNEAKRRFGVVVADPARQLKSALDSIKTRLTNSIADIEYQIATKSRIVKSKTPSPWDAETRLLETRRDALKAQLDELLPKPELTDAQRAEASARTLERNIATLEERIKNRDVAPGTARPPFNSPKLDALRARREALKAEFDELREALTGHSSAQALKALKTRLLNTEARYRERLARGDFGPRARRTITPDAEAQAFKARAEAAKQAFQRGLLDDRLARRSRLRRVADAALRLRREFVLSGFSSIGKLASFSLQEMALGPLKELVGFGLSKVPFVSKVAARSSSEVGWNLGSLVDDYYQAFTAGIRDSRDIARTGNSTLKTLYDPSVRASAEFRAWFGTLHQMEKAPLIRLNFERSFRHRLDFAAKNGVDVSDPGVQQRLGVEAYQDALRGALINRNALAAKVNRFWRSLEEKSKATGRAPFLGKAARFVFEAETPIQHVPLNYISRTAEYAFGLATGSVKLAAAFRRGVETLGEEEANQIMRHLKSGSVGAAAMALGFLAPQLFGGFYAPGRKRQEGELKPGQVKLGGVVVPRAFTHSPLINAAQFGATTRTVADSRLHKTDDTGQGVTAGAKAALFGMIEETPYLRELEGWDKLRNPRTASRWAGERLKNYLVPQGVSQLAEWLDKDANGEPVQRLPVSTPLSRTTVQSVEMGIPGLRQRVPMRSEEFNRLMRRRPLSLLPERERESVREELSKP